MRLQFLGRFSLKQKISSFLTSFLQKIIQTPKKKVLPACYFDLWKCLNCQHDRTTRNRKPSDNHDDNSSKCRRSLAAASKQMSQKMYKLYYFNGRARAEVIRQLFKLASIPFEDIRYSVDEWPKHISEMPFGQMPVLEIDDQQRIAQSMAIARYIARLTARAGKTLEEQATVDALADQYKDFYQEVRPFYLKASGFFPSTPAELEKIKSEIVLPARDKYLRFMTDFLKRSSTGYLAGGDLTFADLILAEHVTSFRAFIPDYTADFPEVAAHQEKVHSIPELKKWLSERPVTPF